MKVAGLFLSPSFSWRAIASLEKLAPRERSERGRGQGWIPAFAGMTDKGKAGDFHRQPFSFWGI
jgi:hypothetical protein